MNVTINGQAREIPTPNTLTGVVAQFCKVNKNIIAELNGNIIPADQWASTSLKENDTIELVSFVGGG